MRTLSRARSTLFRAMTTTGVATALCLLLAAACAKRQDETQPAATPTAATGYPGYPGYPPPQATYGQPYPGQYPPPPATAYGSYPPPAAPTAPAPAPAPSPAPVPPPVAQTAPPATTSAPGQMAVPGPLAFQCQNDVPCGTHHCNLQYGKCAFPCQSAADCISPAQCTGGLCIFPLTPPH